MAVEQVIGTTRRERAFDEDCRQLFRDLGRSRTPNVVKAWLRGHGVGLNVTEEKKLLGRRIVADKECGTVVDVVRGAGAVTDWDRPDRYTGVGVNGLVLAVDMEAE